MSTSVRSSPAGRAQKSDFEIARRLRGLLKDATALALSLNSPDQVAEADCEALLRALQSNEPAREFRSIGHNGGRIQGSSSTSGEYERQQHESGQIGALKVVSAREQEVLQLIGCGLSNKEIAQRLGIGPETVKTHIKRIFVKLQIEKRAQAVASLKDLDCLSRNQWCRHRAYR
jgi:ATP/maltotriose-dependent transcriptional regulator MalT